MQALLNSNGLSQETKPLSSKEGEAATTRAEQAPVELPVAGDQMANNLASENMKLKVNVCNLCAKFGSEILSNKKVIFCGCNQILC